MVIAREVMHNDVHVVQPTDTLAAAATMMRDLHVGALPVLDTDDELRGIITDRDIVVRCLAEGHDPHTVTALELVHNDPIWVDVSADIGDVLATMEENQIRRLPVLELDHLVGIITEASVATKLGQGEVGDFTSAVYSAPPNN
jgi:CBS domain-containing protein